MTITDRDRRELHAAIEQTLGENVADTLMELLPHQPSTDLVTRGDLFATATELRGEMAELRAELRGEMTELRAELRGEMAELRGEMHLEFARLQKWAAGVLAANGAALIAALIT